MGHEIVFAGYTFPPSGLSFSPSFGDVVTRTGRLPGMDGGFDEYGAQTAPNEVGNVTLTFVLVADDRDDMQAKRDAVLNLTRKGRQELRWKPHGYTEYRFCHAKINNIRISQTPSEHSDLWQSVSINFQVSDPRWYEYPFAVWYLDSGEVLDDGLVLAGYAAETITGSGAEIEIELDGTADSLPILTFVSADVNFSVTDLRVVRVDDYGRILDEWTWYDTLGSDEYLVVNCRDYSVTHITSVASIDGIANFQSRRAEFMRLEPGTNRLIIYGTFAGAYDFDVTVDYLEAWR